MRSRKVDTITSNQEQVRLDIFEGRIPLGEAGDRLLEMALAQFHHGEAIARLTALCFEELRTSTTVLHRALNTPWPVRWWRYFTGRRGQ